MRKLILFLSALVVLASCGKKPVAVLSADKTVVVVGEQIHFKGDQSTNAVYYHWKFGDGSTSTTDLENFGPGSSSRVADPIYSYSRAGTFQVTLHVNSKGGNNWNTSDPLKITVFGFSSALTGTWNVAEVDTSQFCSIFPNLYSMTITSDTTYPDEVFITHLANRFSGTIIGYTTSGNLNQIGINQSNIMSDNGLKYNINGTLTLNNTTLILNYSLTPTPGDTVCGIFTNYGSAVH